MMMKVDWNTVGAAFADLRLGKTVLFVETNVGDCIIDPSSLGEFFQDPEAYHAKQLGLSKGDYLSMRAFITYENGRCRGRTKAGKPCNMIVGYFAGRAIQNFVRGIDDHCYLHGGPRPTEFYDRS
jgi:hypothetical protein